MTILTNKQFKELQSKDIFMSKNSMPRNLDKLEEKKEFLKLSDLPEGEHRFRIVQPAIGGFVEWDNNKPIRTEERPRVIRNPDQPPRVFWALYVWDYAQEDLFVIEITQKNLLGALRSFGENEDWGDITSFDIKIKKTKTNKVMNDKVVYDYSVIPVPHKPLSPAIKEALKAKPAALEILYTGGFPVRDYDLYMSMKNDVADFTEDADGNYVA
jgi:hypothetical protein